MRKSGDTPHRTAKRSKKQESSSNPKQELMRLLQRMVSSAALIGFKSSSSINDLAHLITTVDHQQFKYES